MTVKLFIEALIKFILGVVLIGLLIFLPAWTINYFNVASSSYLSYQKPIRTYNILQTIGNTIVGTLIILSNVSIYDISSLNIIPTTVPNSIGIKI